MKILRTLACISIPVGIMSCASNSRDQEARNAYIALKSVESGEELFGCLSRANASAIRDAYIGGSYGCYTGKEQLPSRAGAYGTGGFSFYFGKEVETIRVEIHFPSDALIGDIISALPEVMCGASDPSFLKPNPNVRVIRVVCPELPDL